MAGGFLHPHYRQRTAAAAGYPAAHLVCVFPLQPFLTKPLGYTVQYLSQLSWGYGLEQIFLHAQGYGLPGVVEIIVAGENNHRDPWHALLYLTAKLHAVHKGHAYVGNENIRVFIPDYRQGHLPVGSFAYQCVAVLLPRKRIAYTLADSDLVIHQHYLYHSLYPPCVGMCRAEKCVGCP